MKGVANLPGATNQLFTNYLWEASNQTFSTYCMVKGRGANLPGATTQLLTH